MKLFLYAFRFLVLRIIGYVPSSHIRHSIYRLFGMKLDKMSHIYMGAEIRSPSKISIGKGTSIGHRALLDGRGRLSIGNHVNFGTGVWVWTAEHQVNSLDFHIVKEPVVIEDFVWCSARVTILPGVKIGKGAVIAAGAVVTKDVAPFTIAGGVPAKKIGERSQELKYSITKHHHMI